MKIDGKLLASKILEDLKPQVQELKTKGITPTLGIILIGDDEASKSYIKQKQLKAEEIGAEIKLYEFKSVSEDDLINLINNLNGDPRVHGVIIQRPLPATFDRDVISHTVNPEKDVDGFNQNSNFDAPVAEAVIEILKNNGYEDLRGKKIVVIGKGETAGRPTISLLDKMELSFEIIDSKTENSDELVKNADIIISAVGKSGVIKPGLLNTNQALIGIGLYLQEGKLKGDYEDLEVESKVKLYTPTPGGVGPVNVACLMKNLVKSTSSLSN